jgi:hypothetical protein
MKTVDDIAAKIVPKMHNHCEQRSEMQRNVKGLSS